MREYLEVLLSRAGYQVITAASAKEAADLILKNNLDIVISDIKLGQESGLSVLRAARACAIPPEVILITAYGTPATAVEAMREGGGGCAVGGNQDYLRRNRAGTRRP